MNRHFVHTGLGDCFVNEQAVNVEFITYIIMNTDLINNFDTTANQLEAKRFKILFIDLPINYLQRI